MTLATAIVRRRQQIGWKRKELAELAGVSYPYLAGIETGEKEPSLPVLRQIAAALDVTPGDLLDGRI